MCRTPPAALGQAVADGANDLGYRGRVLGGRVQVPGDPVDEAWACTAYRPVITNG